jgi:hypothetical protein
MAPPHFPPPAERSDAESSAAEPPPAAVGDQAAIAARPKARRVLPAEPANRQRGVAALFLALLSLFGLLGLNNFQRGIYIVAFTLLAGGMAVWLAITSLSRARRGGTVSPRGSVVAVVIGAIGVLLSGSLLIMLTVFGKQAVAYSNCLQGANTISAQQACQNQFVRSVEGKASAG